MARFSSTGSSDPLEEDSDDSNKEDRRRRENERAPPEAPKSTTTQRVEPEDSIREKPSASPSDPMTDVGDTQSKQPTSTGGQNVGAPGDSPSGQKAADTEASGGRPGAPGTTTNSQSSAKKSTPVNERQPAELQSTGTRGTQADPTPVNDQPSTPEGSPPVEFERTEQSPEQPPANRPPDAPQQTPPSGGTGIGPNQTIEDVRGAKSMGAVPGAERSDSGASSGSGLQFDDTTQKAVENTLIRKYGNRDFDYAEVDGATIVRFQENGETRYVPVSRGAEKLPEDVRRSVGQSVVSSAFEDDVAGSLEYGEDYTYQPLRGEGLSLTESGKREVLADQYSDQYPGAGITSESIAGVSPAEDGGGFQGELTPEARRRVQEAAVERRLGVSDEDITVSDDGQVTPLTDEGAKALAEFGATSSTVDASEVSVSEVAPGVFQAEGQNTGGLLRSPGNRTTTSTVATPEGEELVEDLEARADINSRTAEAAAKEEAKDAQQEAQRRFDEMQGDFQQGNLGDPEEVVAEEAAASLSERYGFNVTENDVEVTRAGGQSAGNSDGGSGESLLSEETAALVAGSGYRVQLSSDVARAGALVESARQRAPGTVSVSREGEEFSVEVTGPNETTAQSIESGLSSELRNISSGGSGGSATVINAAGQQSVAREPLNPFRTESDSGDFDPVDNILSTSRELTGIAKENVVEPLSGGAGEAVDIAGDVATYPVDVATGGDAEISTEGDAFGERETSNVVLGAGNVLTAITAGSPLIADKAYQTASGSAEYAASHSIPDSATATADVTASFIVSEAERAYNKPFRFAGEILGGALIGGVSGRAFSKYAPERVKTGRTGRVLEKADFDPGKRALRAGRSAAGRVRGGFATVSRRYNAGDGRVRSGLVPRQRRRGDADADDGGEQLGVPDDDPFRVTDKRLYDPARTFGESNTPSNDIDPTARSGAADQDIGPGIAGKGDPEAAPGADFTWDAGPAVSDAALQNIGGLTGTLAGASLLEEAQERNVQSEEPVERRAGTQELVGTSARNAALDSALAGVLRSPTTLVGADAVVDELGGVDVRLDPDVAERDGARTDVDEYTGLFRSPRRDSDVGVRPDVEQRSGSDTRPDTDTRVEPWLDSSPDQRSQLEFTPDVTFDPDLDPDPDPDPTPDVRPDPDPDPEIIPEFDEEESRKEERRLFAASRIQFRRELPDPLSGDRDSNTVAEAFSASSEDSSDTGDFEPWL